MKLEVEGGARTWSGGGAARRDRFKGRAQAGQRGEQVAVEHLEALGYQVVARNWRDRQGELDVVARRGPWLVFVEVRARRGRGLAPEQTVRAQKRARVAAAALRWLARQPEASVRGLWMRFDVVGVRLPGGQVTHLEGAFGLGER
jgi:putative endonuclease